MAAAHGFGTALRRSPALGSAESLAHLTLLSLPQGPRPSKADSELCTHCTRANPSQSRSTAARPSALLAAGASPPALSGLAQASSLPPLSPPWVKLGL